MVTNPNPGSASSSQVPVKVGPGQVVLLMQPSNGTDVRVSNTLNLGLNITGTNNTGVTLKVNGVPGGNAQVGTAASQKDGSINYTAPAVVPTPNNVVQLTITSVDNPSVSIGQNISVENPIPILNAASPNLVHQRDDLGTTALHNAAFWVSVSGPISGGKGVRISMRGIRVRSDPGGLGNRIYTRDGWVSRD